MGGDVGRADVLAAAADRRCSWPACRARARRPPTAKLARWLQRGARLVGRRRRLRRLPPGRRRPARDGRRARSARPCTSRAPTSDPVEIARWALDQAKMDGKDVLIVDTSRPPARRRGADAASSSTSATRVRPTRRPARRRRHDRPGRRQRRRAVRRGRRLRRRRDDQARRRRPRRRRAVGQGRHRQADPLRLHRREARPASSASTPTAWPSGSSAWATSCRSSRSAERQFDEDEAKELERKLRRNEFTLEDFLGQLKQIRKMGPLDEPAGDDARASAASS